MACAADHGDEECPGYPDDREGAEEEQPGTAPQVFFAHTAFLVMQTPEGETILIDDINLPVAVTRRPTRDEMYGMLSCGIKDITIAEAAAHTAGASAQATVAAIEAKQREALAAAQQAMAEHREQAQNDGIVQEINRRGGMRAP